MERTNVKKVIEESLFLAIELFGNYDQAAKIVNEYLRKTKVYNEDTFFIFLVNNDLLHFEEPKEIQDKEGLYAEKNLEDDETVMARIESLIVRYFKEIRDKFSITLE